MSSTGRLSSRKTRYIPYGGLELIHRKPLITSHFAHQPPSYAAVHVDAYNHHARSLAHSSASPSGVADGSSLPAILWVDTLTKAATTSAQAGSGGAGLCHVQREGLKFLVPLGQEGELSLHNWSSEVWIGKWAADVNSEPPVCICVSRIVSRDAGAVSRGRNRGQYQGQL